MIGIRNLDAVSVLWGNSGSQLRKLAIADMAGKQTLRRFTRPLDTHSLFEDQGKGTIQWTLDHLSELS